jgi:hypothetical protein
MLGAIGRSCAKQQGAMTYLCPSKRQQENPKTTGNLFRLVASVSNGLMMKGVGEEDYPRAFVLGKCYELIIFTSSVVQTSFPRYRRSHIVRPPVRYG